MDKTLSQYHDEIISAMRAKPGAPDAEIAKAFGMSQHWLSLMVSSDMFQSRLMAANEKGEKEDAIAIKTVTEKTEAVASLGLDIVAERLEAGRTQLGTLPTDELVNTTFAAMKMNGYGPQPRGPGVTIDARTIIQNPHVSADVLAGARETMLLKKGASVELQSLPAPSAVDAG